MRTRGWFFATSSGIWASVDADRQKFEDFVKRENIAWPQYFDGQGGAGKLAAKYAINSIPATFLLDGDGKIVARNLRGAALEDAIQEALRNK